MYVAKQTYSSHTPAQEGRVKKLGIVMTPTLPLGMSDWIKAYLQQSHTYEAKP